MRTLVLRRVDALTHSRLQTVRRWREAGHCAGVGNLDGQSGFLSFCARGEQGDWRGLIQAGDWLHHSLPQLQSVLPDACSVNSIAGLFRAVSRPLMLEVEGLHDRDLSEIELIDSVCAQQLPWLDTARGRVWVMDLPPDQPSNRAPQAASWLSDLPLRLVLQLGVSHLSRASHRRLRQGDVLRITQLTHHCVLAERGIGVFTFTKEGLHMELTAVDSHTQAVVEPSSGGELAHLPVRLEFVLATRDIDLGALQHIIDGQLIALDPDASQHIEVRANGKSVARGELVQLDAQLGVELLEVYRNASDE